MRAIRELGSTLALVASAVLLGGCAATYKTVGMYQGRDDVLVGAVHADLSSGTSRFTLTGVHTGLSCEGTTNVSNVPSSLSCQGQSGTVVATCNDGSILHGRWFATGCATGFGYGVDSDGNKLTFKFGLSGDQVQAEVASDDRALAKLREQQSQRAAGVPPKAPAPRPQIEAPGSETL